MRVDKCAEVQHKFKRGVFITKQDSELYNSEHEVGLLQNEESNDRGIGHGIKVLFLAQKILII